MTAPSTARDIARLLGLADDAGEQEFARLASNYAVDAQYEHHRSNHVAGASLTALSDLAARGVELCRAERSVHVLQLLAAAAIEVIPVGAAVCFDIDLSTSMPSVAISANGAMVVRAVHADYLTALQNASRALLAREGATGPACDALRGAL